MDELYHVSKIFSEKDVIELTIPGSAVTSPLFLRLEVLEPETPTNFVVGLANQKKMTFFMLDAEVECLETY